MYNPRPDIVNWLKNEGINIVKQSQNVFNELPTVTYYLASQNNQLSLDNKIVNSTIAIQIDIWTDTGPKGSEILTQIEGILRQKNYNLVFSSDLPNIDSEVNHITARFETQK